MIESVQARQRGAYDFASHYDNLCLLQNSCPLQSVKSHIEEGVLDINADRIRLPDWTPVLNSIKINKSLQYVGIRSYYQYVTEEEEVSEAKRYAAKKKAPSIRSKEVTYRLAQSLKECLTVTPSLTILELQGLPLRERDLSALTKGLAKNTSLSHLSLEYCRIGDAGVDVVCQGIKNSVNIHSLNLTGCSVTSKGADTLAKVIKHQATKRHSEAWQDSLRYRRPDLDRMSGLRRLTLNSNSLINDAGAIAMADSLRDDLWLKALDMQQCGVSDIGAKALLDVLKTNSTLVVLDLRKNPLIDRDLLKDVMEQVLINSGGQETEYKWLKITSPREGSKKSKSRKKTKTLNSSFGRKTTIRISTGASRSRTRSAVSTRTISRHSGNSPPEVTKPGPGFIPWRTAARASRHINYPADRDPGMLSIEANCESSTPDITSSTIHMHKCSTPSDMDAATDGTTPITSMRLLQHDKQLQQHPSVLLDNSYEVDVRHIKDLQVELEEVKRRFFVESRARAAGDARIVELEVENSRLKHQLQLMEARGPSSPFRTKPIGMDIPDFEDESVLDSIEASFNKFHAFLDLLRDAGLGQLCTLVGLTPEDIRRPGVASILQQHQPQPYQPPPSTYKQPPPPPTVPQEAWNQEPSQPGRQQNGSDLHDRAEHHVPEDKETHEVEVKANENELDPDEEKDYEDDFEVEENELIGDGEQKVAIPPAHVNGGHDSDQIDSMQAEVAPQPIVIGEEEGSET
ncbi:centrosomal protein of 78 kDa-like [Glandiceps talaboti]